MSEVRLNYRDEIAQEIITRIEAGTAPWQVPWKAGQLGVAPFNPVSGKPYRGINDLWLSMRGYSDPRWLTYNQAIGLDAQVRKGEKSATIEYWQWTEAKPITDANGKPVLGDDGKQQVQTVRLDRPKVFYAKVFNASQIEGLDPFKLPSPSFDPVGADTLIAGAGVAVLHDQNGRAYYSPNEDRIHLPQIGAFRGQAAYYETALHELGHATGHPSRLNRTFGPFGSELYAREELRAEIASYMLARDMGVSHDPGNHASYVESWLKVLREDKNEIFRAAKDAETIKTWVMQPEQRQALEQAAQSSKAVQGHNIAEPKEPAMGIDPNTGAATEDRPARAYIDVPFAEKDQAKAAGAKWDRNAKSWYVPHDQDLAAFAQWQKRDPLSLSSGLSPQDEFAQALKEHGLIVKGVPVMNGEWQRVMVDGDKGDEKSGSYRGFLDGRPSGAITNYKAGIQGKKWVATGQALTEEAKAHIQAEAEHVRADRAAAQSQAEEHAAKTAFGVWNNLQTPATKENCAYLARKGVDGHGVKVDDDGKLIVPGRDGQGRILTFQSIDATGIKRFLKGSRKAGTMHIIERLELASWQSFGQGPILVGEGYATASTVFEATGRPIAAAFDSGNLMAVAQAARDKFPDRPILIVADNDHANKLGNVGLTKAQAVVQEVKGPIMMVAPTFTAEEMAKGLTDFNDLAGSRGKAAVKNVIESALSKLLDRSQERGVA